MINLEKIKYKKCQPPPPPPPSEPYFYPLFLNFSQSPLQREVIKIYSPPLLKRAGGGGLNYARSISSTRIYNPILMMVIKVFKHKNISRWVD